MDRALKIVIIGSSFSLVLFIIFLILQVKGASLLELESRWLLVASVPIFVSLIVGGYIRKFKGFGVEIETRLKSKIGTSDLRATDALEQVEGADKSTLSFLYDTPSNELYRKERLILIEGRKNYYDSFALSQYLDRIIYLKYLEIQDQARHFRYIVTISAFKTNDEIKMNMIDIFLKNLSERSLPSDFEPYVEFEYIKISDRLLSILPKVRESKFGWLPVVNENKNMVGVVTKEAIESRVADEVLAAQAFT